MIVDDSKKLILGLLSGLSLEQAKPFFLSLEKSGYRGDVCLFVRELGSATQAFLRARRVQLIPFPKAFLQRFSAGAGPVSGIFFAARKTRAVSPPPRAGLHAPALRAFFFLPVLPSGMRW